MDAPKSNTPPGLLDRLARSRDFVVSFVIHLAIVLVFGTTVLFRVVQEPDDFAGELAFSPPGVARPSPDRSQTALVRDFNPLDVVNPSSAPGDLPSIITTPGGTPLILPAPGSMPRDGIVGPILPPAPPQPAGGISDRPPREAAEQIGRFVEGWVQGGTGGRSPQYRFTAFLGRYSGGDWNSTVRVAGDRIESGSLPNLLYLMSFWSKDRIQTNHRDVRAIRLDSDELFVERPPFIFLTGTRDFVLTEREVENLRKYILSGGCVWGDSSLPGLRSRFDIAFRREMKRVIPDLDKNFEPLAADHPIFTQGYFKGVRELPAGVNFYRSPVEVLRVYGQIAVIYTSNDYGDLWQIGLNSDGQIDLRRDQSGRYVAVNDQLYNLRGTYVRNVEPEAIRRAFEFGTNVVIHLLTRWEGITRGGSTL